MLSRGQTIGYCLAVLFGGISTTVPLYSFAAGELGGHQTPKGAGRFLQNMISET